jgi:hypothetical protein
MTTLLTVSASFVASLPRVVSCGSHKSCIEMVIVLLSCSCFEIESFCSNPVLQTALSELNTFLQSQQLQLCIYCVAIAFVWFATRPFLLDISYFKLVKVSSN